MFNYGFKQMANHPTRITGNTSTLIDHILTNGQNNISQCGVINTAISDHNIIHCTRRISKDKYNTINILLLTKKLPS